MITIADLIREYQEFARDYYAGSTELENCELSFRQLRKMFAELPAADFGPLKLKAVRQQMIDDNLCRRECNKRIGRIKRLFRWAAENELIAGSVLQGLLAVKGLAYGRTKARETAPVGPVSEQFIEAVRPHVTAQIWAMIQVQRFTGMRPGEVARMRTCDIDRNGEVWTYRPSKHKTSWRGHAKSVFIGPRAQDVLRPWLREEPDHEEFLFQPRDAMATLRAKQRAERATPRALAPKSKRAPQKEPGRFYTTRSYHRAIRVACSRAGVPHWHPHQLRHNVATWLRKDFGIDAARVILGHRSAKVTEVYAELDHDKAIQVIARVG